MFEKWFHVERMVGLTMSGKLRNILDDPRGALRKRYPVKTDIRKAKIVEQLLNLAREIWINSQIVQMMFGHQMN